MTSLEEKNLKRDSKMPVFVKFAVFGLVTLFLVVGTFYFEGVFASPTASEQNFSPFFSDDIILRFDEEKSVDEPLKKLFDDAVAISESVKLWGNFKLSTRWQNLLVGENVVIVPNHAVFDLEFDGDHLNLMVFDGDVYVGFLQKGVGLTDAKDPYDSIFVNKLLVPRGRSISINVKKLDERYEKLLYTKLVKEFKYVAIAGAVFASDWVKTNMADDDALLEAKKREFATRVIFGGKSANDGFVGRFLFWSEENLTFVPQKKKEILFEHLFGYLDDAIFYLSEADTANFGVSMEKFDGALSSLPLELKTSEDFYQRYDAYLQRLAIFDVADEQYKISKELLSRKFASGRDVFEVVNLAWLNVYKGLEQNSVLAEDVLNSYYKYFDASLVQNASDDYLFYYITFNNQLFDNLLLSSPLFYKDGYFAMKNVLEEHLLKLYQDGQMKNELKQTLITAKITFLKRLMAYFFGEKVNVVTAKKIVSRLVAEINALMPEFSSSVAVVEIFESELAEIADFWGFLNTPEYQTSKTYGLTQKARYESYLSEKDRIWNFVNVQEDVLGDSPKEITEATIVVEITQAFAEVSGIDNLKIDPITDLSQRFVKIAATVQGYPITGMYDRDSGLIKEVYAYDELISDRAVKLSSLFSILSNKFANIVPEVTAEDGKEEPSVETYAQRFARSFVAKRVGEAGFILEMENVEVVNELNAVYRVKGAQISENDKVLLTFDFLMNGEMATNVYVTVDKTPLVIEGKYTLEELYGIALAEGDFSGGVSR
ncbi:hypothetical protein HY604_02885 [Candidatus Peregrinibacteria bacterium]|nr:hypothetical protein [Candidatus Peregrinibacteria bacterium]